MQTAMMTRQRKTWLAAAIALSAAVAGGVLIGLLPLYPSKGMAGGIAAIILIGVFLAMTPRWRMLDYMQRDSRLVSWYWGGSFGGGLGLVLTIILGGVRSPLFAGAAMVWLLQCAGYVLVRVRWWFAHRSTPA